MPLVRLGPGRDGQRVRPDAVPLPVLLSPLPSAVRGIEADLDGERDRRRDRRRDDGRGHRPGCAGGWARGRPERRRRGSDRARQGQGPGGPRETHSLDAVGAEADVVIEAALEDLDLKRTVFRTLDAAVGDRAGVILATNTSALSVGAIADATSQPGRVVGLHFFNPAPIMALVEVVAHDRSDPAVVDRAIALVEAWGKVPVRSTDSPGFIVNRVNRPFTIEALRMVEADEASVEAIDEAMREAGFPMGPFELMDLVGVDVNLAAATAVWDGLGRPDRLRPSPIQEQLVAAERLGRKSGRGFYRYEDGRRAGVDTDFASADPGAPAGAISGRILAAVAAEATRARDDGVASAADIGRALKLGAAHPRSPFEEA
jgi:3-hydroxybutyryl-CoA dehydrogenase